MKIVKKKRNNDSQSQKRGKERDSVIIKRDSKTYELMLNKGKLNVR